MFRNTLGIDQNKVYTNSDIHSIFGVENIIPIRSSKPTFSSLIDTCDLIDKVIENLQSINKYRDKNEMLDFILLLLSLLEYSASDKFVLRDARIIIKKDIDKLIITDTGLTDKVFINTSNHICITIYETLNYIYTRIHSVKNFRLI